jgi:hypothetical protein
MAQDQLPILMIPTAYNAALTLELQGLILVVVEDLPGDIPTVPREIIKAEWQSWQGCGALRCHTLP